MKRLWLVVDCLAVFMALSALLYVFTGLHFWAPVERNEHGMPEMARSMGLVLVHLLIPLVAAMRRV